jgi:hypothetical protein
MLQHAVCDIPLCRCCADTPIYNLQLGLSNDVHACQQLQLFQALTRRRGVMGRGRDRAPLVKYIPLALKGNSIPTDWLEWFMSEMLAGGKGTPLPTCG